MEINYPGSHDRIIRAPVERNILPFVEAIGIDAAALLFLALGGSAVYIGEHIHGRNKIIDAIGNEAALKLSAARDTLPSDLIRLPLGNRFVLRVLRKRGHSVAEIARQLRVSDWTVRRWMKADEAAERKRQNGR